MSDQDRSKDGDAPSTADRTLLGVAPPRLESSADSPPHSPVFVRSGTSVANSEPGVWPQTPRAGHPPSSAANPSIVAQAPSATRGNSDNGGQAIDRAVRFTRSHPALWMALAPALLAVFTIAVLSARSPGPRSEHLANARRSAASPSPIEPHPAASSEQPTPGAISALEARAPESLNSREVLLLAEDRSERQRAKAGALFRKVMDSPALGKDPAIQSDLLRLADDPRTARDALAALAALEGPISADLLYEVWTRTPVQSDTTELARRLVSSTDVRAKASPALAVALELRAAETCQKYQTILPLALKDGDRRSLHLLAKLTSKRGCGPKKAQDCYACLRTPRDELSATLGAVKGRRPPSYGAP